MSAYLEVAEKVLKKTGVPMNSKEILHAAYSMNLLSVNLYGKTQHKTFHARISVDIRKRGEKSAFYRAGRGVFFLNELRNSPNLSKQHKEGIHAIPRFRELNREPVLEIKRSTVNRLVSEKGIFDADKLETLLFHENVKYGNAKKSNEQYCKLWVFVVVQKQEEILSYRHGKYRENKDSFLNKRTIGFKSLVTINDRTFLDSEDSGIVYAGLSATFADLGIPFDSINVDVEKKSAEIEFFLNYCTDAGDNELICIVNYLCPEWLEPLKRTLAINDLTWLKTTHQPNNIDDFDGWSQLIIPKLFSIYSKNPKECGNGIS